MTDGDQATPESNPVVQEFGVSGLKRSGGQVTEEVLSTLQGARGLKVYGEMLNDPLIGGVILGMNEVLSRLDWHIEPPDAPTAVEAEQADFTQECLDDMSDGWDVTLEQIMSMVPYGWSFLETVYKTREGASSDPTRRSKYSDGRVGWRKFALRSQDTLGEWVFDKSGGIRGLVQQDPQGGRTPIPIQRALLFRTSEYKGNPEGRSMLRSAYRPWMYMKRIEEIEAIGIERDLAGLPKAWAPEAWFAEKNNQNLTALREMVINARRNEIDGVILPMKYDEHGHPLVGFELMSTGGNRQFDTNAVVGRYNNKIATSMLMDFMTLGHEETGSYALGTAKISMWQLVIQSIAKSIASVINQHAIPRLMRLNGWTPDRMPRLVFGDVAQADLAVLGAFLDTMIRNGVIVPDEALEAKMRELANLPAATLSTAEPANAAGTPVVTDPAAAAAEMAAQAVPEAPATVEEPTVGTADVPAV